MIDQSNVVIIIPHLGSSREQEYALDQCLLSLKETVPGTRIIIAANGRKACSHEWDVHVALQGQCGAVNAAVATVDTEWIFVTNDDMIYCENWFERLTTYINWIGNEEREILCISPKLIEPRPGAPTFEVFFAGGAGGDFNKESWNKFVKDYYERKIFEVRTGFNLPFLIKKELWDLIGGYDVNYDPWGSNGDSDLEYKVRLAGVQPCQNTHAIVYHYSQTSATFSPENRPFWDKNWHYFIEKWGFERASGNQIWEANFEIPEDKLKYRPFWKGFYKK